MKRALGALVVGALLVEGLVACGSADNGTEQAVNVVDTPDTVKNANVQIGLLDSTGIRRGSCSGVLIGARMVLTAGHCIAGKGSWSILSAQGSRAKGVRGYTADWFDFETQDAHPARHDIGVIMLDRDITLPVYPKLANSEAESGANLVRIRNLTGQTFEARSAYANHLDAMPHTYTTGFGDDESLDTGGAVLNEKGAIVGVVSGRGLTTGNLYVARVDAHFTWLSEKNTCSTGGADSSYEGEIGVACHPSGDGGNTNGGTGCTKDAGGGTSGGGSTGGGSTGGGSTGGGSGSGSGGASSGGSSGGGGTCNESGGNCSGDCPSGGGSSVTGSDGSASDGSGSGGGASGGSGGSGSGSSSGSTTGSNGSTSGGSSGGSGGSGSSGSNSGSNPGSAGNPSGGSFGGSASGGDGSGAGGSAANGGTNTGSSSGSNTGSSSGSNTGSSSGTSGGSSSGSSGGATGSIGGSTGSSTGSTTGSTGGSSGSTGSTSGGRSPSGSTVVSNIPDRCAGGCPDSTIDYGDCGCVAPTQGSNVIK